MSFIDERVVKMVFDSAKFEKGIAKTMELLDKFQNALLLKGASTGLDNLEKTIGSFNMNGLNRAIDTVSDRFSTLGIIGTTALIRITNQAIDAGERLLKSLSVDQVAAGWHKFGEKTSAVGTLVSQGNELEFVNDQMDRLNWFTDETSYNFTDMANNIAKFTATGKGLEESVTMMQGIALWAAASGQNASTASRAMYQLSQAMGSGVMRKEDWKSIQNTSMDTDEFRQIALDTAVALGKLKKTGEDTYQSLQSKSKAGAAEFKKAQFADSLTEGAWFDADVMEAVYKKYGSASEVIREFVETNDQDIEKASEAIKAIEERDKALVDSEAAKRGLSIEETTKALIEEGKILDPLAIKWFKAGQEARTFADVIDSVKDAVSTQFMNMFQNIFGNYEEAKTLWTDLANALWDMFAGPLQQVNDLLDIWNKLGGRTIFLNSLKNGWEAILALTDPIKKAFENIFPNEMKAGKLYQLTKEFYKFTASLKIGRDFADKIQRSFQGVFSVFDLVGQAISAVGRTIADFGGPIITLARNFLGLTGSVGDFVTDMAKAAKENDFFYNSIQKLIEFISPAFETVKNIIDGAIQAFEKFTGIDLHIPTFQEFADAVSHIGFVLDPVISVLRSGAEGIHNFFETLNQSQAEGAEKKVGIFQKIGEIIGKLAKILGPVLNAVKNAFGQFLDYFSQALDKVDGNKVTALLGGGLFAFVGLKIKDFIDNIKDKLKPLDDIKSALSDLKDSLIDTFGAIQQNLQAGTLLKIAFAIGILAASLIALSSTENLGTGLAALGGIMLELVAFLGIIEGISKLSGSGLEAISKVSSGFIKLAAAVFILSKAMESLGKLKEEEITRGLIAIGGVLLELAAYIGILSVIDRLGGKLDVASKGMLEMAAAILVLSVASKVFATMEWDEIGKGLAGVGGMLLELALFSKLAGGAKHVMATGVAMVAIAAALTVLTGVLFIMGKTADTMGSGLLVLAGLLLELGVALYFMEGSIVGAVAMLACAAAIAVLTPALIALGAAMTGDGIARALITLAGALLVIGAAAAIFGTASPIIIAGAVALGAFSAAVLLAGVAIAAFGAGLTVFTAALVAAGSTLIAGLGIIQQAISLAVTLTIEAFKQMLQEAVTLIPFVVELGLMVIDGFLQGIANHLPSIIASGAAIILAVLTGINEYLPQILQAGIDLMITFIDGMANGIRDNTDKILAALGNLMSAMIELVLTAVQGLVKNIPGIGEDISKMLEDLKTGVKDTLAPEDFEDIANKAAASMTHEFETASGEVYETGGKTGAKFGEAIGEQTGPVEEGSKKLTDTMNSTLGGSDVLSMLGDTGGTDIQAFLDGAGLKTGDVETMMKSMAGTATDNLGNGDGKYTTAGGDAVLGFIGGMGSHDSEVSAEAQRIATLALSSMTSKQGLDEHSPSKKTYKIGVNAGKGFILGLEDTGDEAEKTAKKVGDRSAKALKDGVDAEIGILDYADGAVGAFMNHWTLMQDNMSDTAAFQASKDAIELLALQMYAASDASKQAVTDAEGNATAVEDILNGIKKTYTDMRNSIIQTMDSQTDMLSMFDFGEAVRPEEMLENMESNLRAIDTYYQNIETLTERGIDDGLLRHLEELGPKGAAQMRSFIQMTDEQLEKANQMWQEKGEKMSHAADHVIGALAYSSVQSAGGFVDGLDPETGEVAAQTYIEAALQKMRETVGVNLQNFEAVGGEVADSVAKGITKSSESDTETDKAAKTMSSDVVGTVDSNVKKEDGVAIGYRLCEGIAQGLRDGIEIATTAAEEMAFRLIQIVKDTLGIASPSKAFMELGYYSDEGLAQGFSKYGTVVREAAAESALGAVDEMSGVFGRIADLIDGTIDLDPTIRPVLDLSNIQYGASQIGSLLGLNDPYALNAVGTISGIQNDASLMASLTGSLTDAINGMKSDNDLPPVTINIYPKEGQSAEEIAEVVSWKLNHDVLKRRAAYGGAR